MKGFHGHLALTVTGGLKEVVTPWAGASILVEVYRRYGVGDATERALPRKKTSKGLSQGQMTESFVLLSALGGECIEDMERLRQDKGLEAMLGYQIPAPETARQWLIERCGEVAIRQTVLYHLPMYRTPYSWQGRAYKAAVDGVSGKVFPADFPAKAEAPYVGVAALALIVFGMEGLIIQNLVVKLVAFMVSAVPILAVAWLTSRKV